MTASSGHEMANGNWPVRPKSNCTQISKEGIYPSKLILFDVRSIQCFFNSTSLNRCSSKHMSSSCHTLSLAT